MQDEMQGLDTHTPFAYRSHRVDNEDGITPLPTLAALQYTTGIS